MIASLSSIFPEVSVIQQSSLSPSRLQASASHAAAGSASLATGSEPWILIADTRTHETSNLFQVEFTVDEPTAYGLTAGVAAMGGGFIGETAVHVELRRASGEVLHRIALEDDEDCLDPSCLDLGSLALDEGGRSRPAATCSRRRWSGPRRPSSRRARGPRVGIPVWRSRRAASP